MTPEQLKASIDLKLDEPMIYKVGTPKLKEEMTNLDWMK